MPASYAIGTHFEQFIKIQIESGRYASASEVVREALRLLEDQELMRQTQLVLLKKKLQDGIDSGPGIPSEEVLERLEAKYKGLES